MNNVLSLNQIRSWFDMHQRRLRVENSLPTMVDIASRSGVSRQTLYAILRDDRSEFGEVAQIRLSRVIVQISSEPSYQYSRLSRIDFSGHAPRIKFGV
jgi:DNA-binding XRE family transcriptional regulator